MGFDQDRTSRAVLDLLAGFGMDPASPELRETPDRVAEFWKERLAGYGVDVAAELQPLPGIWPPAP